MRPSIISIQNYWTSKNSLITSPNFRVCASRKVSVKFSKFRIFHMIYYLPIFHLMLFIRGIGFWCRRVSPEFFLGGLPSGIRYRGLLSQTSMGGVLLSTYQGVANCKFFPFKYGLFERFKGKRATIQQCFADCQSIHNLNRFQSISIHFNHFQSQI